MGFQQGTGQTIMQQLIEKVFGPATEGQENMNIFSRIIDETTTGIQSAFASEAFQTKLDSIVDTLKPIMTDAIRKLMKALNDTWLGYIIPNSSFESPDDARQAEIDNLGKLILKQLEQTAELDPGINAKAIEATKKMLADYKGMTGGTEFAIPEQYSNLPLRRVGTLKATGKMTEPKDTNARIHAGERVLNASEAGAVNDLPGAIKQLNTLTAQVRDLMAQSVQYQEKTARGIRKLGSDMIA